MIKQSVNLYLPEFRTKKDQLSPVLMVQLLALGVVLFALFAGYEYWQVQQANTTLTDLNAQRAAAVSATTALRASFGSQSPDREIVAANAELEATLSEKKAIVEVMSSSDLGNSIGFSEYMSDLARFHTDGLSLKSIALQQNGKSVKLAGEVLRPELVTIYLRNLDQGQSFKGMSFHTLNIGETAVAKNAQSVAESAPTWTFSVSTVQ